MQDMTYLSVTDFEENRFLILEKIVLTQVRVGEFKTGRISRRSL